MTMALQKGLFKLDPIPSAKAIAKNEAILAVVSASILSPILVPKISEAVARLPDAISGHASLAAAIPALLLFRIGITMSNRVLGALVLGVAGSFVLTAIMPIVSPILNKVQS